MKQKVLKSLDLSMEIGWLAIFFFLPLFFVPFIHGSWQISGSFLFQTLVEIICFFWLVGIVLAPEKINDFKKHFKFVLPAVVFILVLGLATIFSHSPYCGFFGSYVRKMGYLTWLHFFVFFLVLFFNLTPKRINRVFYVIIAATGIAVLYGFLQIFGLDFFRWSESPSFGHRVFSTFGQPNFLASWLLLTLPVVLWAVFSAKGGTASGRRLNLMRPVFVCLLFLSLFVFILTQSRGGWFGFYLSFFFFVVVFSRRKKKKNLAVLLLTFFLFSTAFLGFLNASPLAVRQGDNPLIVRLKTLSNLSGAGKLRLIWWRNSIDLIGQKPWLGYGPETQEMNFAGYYQPEYAVLEGINQMPDRAHNDFLDTLLISGILGLLSYVFLIVSAFWLGLKRILRKTSGDSEVCDPEFMILVLLTGLFGYLVSLQFSFHFIVAAAYFWAYLAMVLKIPAIKEQNTNQI